jgi:N-acetylglucosamine kinase-like BadF-type ATPase
MYLIADGGSTKTEWRLIKDDRTMSLRTIGINPLFSDKDQIIRVLEESDINLYKAQIDQVYFYGAGLANEALKEILGKIFRQFFSDNTELFINDDLIAAARALFKNKQGIACILGTGSNSCLYSGQQIEDKIPALGYILGDEGSGAAIGKIFINALLKRDFSDELSQILHQSGAFDMNTVIENVYRKPLPNRYLASFTKVIKEHIAHAELEQLVKSAFDDFVFKNLKKYKGNSHLPVGFVGSVAYHFKDILNASLTENGFSEAQIIQSPIDELVAYHKQIRLKSK